MNFNFEILKKVAKSIKINCIELFEKLDRQVFFLSILVKNAVKFKEFHQNLKSFFCGGWWESRISYIWPNLYMCRKICDRQKIKTKTKVLKRYQDIETYSWIIKVMNIDWFLSQTINLTVKSVTQYVSPLWFNMPRG